MQELRVTDPTAGPYGVVAGPDGALWITLVHGGRIARLTVDGDVEEYPLDSAASGPSIITVGGDGALWFTRNRDDRIGRVTTEGKQSSIAVRGAPFGARRRRRPVVHRDERQRHRPHHARG